MPVDPVFFSISLKELEILGDTKPFTRKDLRQLRKALTTNRELLLALWDNEVEEEEVPPQWIPL